MIFKNFTLFVFISTLIFSLSCEKGDDIIKVRDVFTDFSFVVLAEGDTQLLTVAVLPYNATDKSLTWSSSNDNIVSVNDDGLINAISVGVALITVTTIDGNKSVTISVSVVDNWLSLSQNVIESSVIGGVYEINISSSKAWSIQSKPQWVTVSPISGNTTGVDSALITISVPQLTGMSIQRSGEMIFKLDERDLSDTLIINQNKSQFSDGDYIKVQSSSIGDGIDLVFLGDGYTVVDVNSGKFDDNIYEAIEHFFDIEPYRTYRNYFDVYFVYAFSEESGISDHEISKNTKFSAKYDNPSTTRMSIDRSVAFEYAQKVPLSADLTETQITVITNSSRYGGTSWSYSNGMSISVVPVSNRDFPNDFRGLLQHEAGGHGFGQLADEYAENSSTIPESVKENLIKWQEWGFFKNVDLTDDPSTILWKHFIADSTYSYVGVYEGGYTYTSGVWRPESVSLMADNIQYINAPSRELIVKRIKKLAGETYSFEEFKRNDVREIHSLTKSSAVSTDESLKLLPPILIEVY